MSTMKLLSIGLPIVLVAAALAVQSGALQGTAPGDLGVRDGRLKPPSNTPNSVSSQAALYPEHPQRTYAAIEPLPFKRGGAEASMEALRQVVINALGLKAAPGQPVFTGQGLMLNVQLDEVDALHDRLCALPDVDFLIGHEAIDRPRLIHPELYPEPNLYLYPCRGRART